MIHKEIYIKRVISSLAILSNEVEMLNCVNFYDINIIAEDFYAQLLNKTYGYKLYNINHFEKNAPAIDLVDDECRISFQVTSDNDSEKIKDTIKKFIEHNKYLKYDRLVILILTKKKKYSTKFDTDNKFNFDIKKDIIDYTDLIKDIRIKDTNVLKEICQLLEEGLVNKLQNIKTTNASEVDTIIDLIEYISKNREKKDKRDTVIDPEYKIEKRFKDFAIRLKSDYITLLTIYGQALNMINSMLEIDEAQDLITTMYLQDISIQKLDETSNDPVKALELLVSDFEEKLSQSGKKYDKAAIKFYLINELIKCNVFPNERSEYNVDK